LADGSTKKKRNMSIKKSILIISYSNLKNDPRVFRQIINLNKVGYQITAIGFSNPQVQGVNFIGVDKKESLLKKILFGVYLLFGFYEKYYWSQKKIKQSIEKVKGLEFDLIFANDLDTLPLAFKLKSELNCKILFDAHEYSPREHEDRLIWNLLFKKYTHNILQNYKKYIDFMFTVCKGIADEYKKNYNLSPLVVTNATEYHEISPTIPKLKKIRMIHHGGSMKSRKIENMIMMMDEIDERYSLDLMLVNTDKTYHNYLIKLTNRRKNVTIIPPVEMHNIVNFISKYDIGLYILEPTNFNNGMALPNKIFEFIQARLAIAIGPSPEMKSLVEEYNLGVVSADFDSKGLAISLNNLTHQNIIDFKKNSDEIAKKVNSEENVKIILKTVHQLIGNPVC